MTKKDEVLKASRQFCVALTRMANGDAGSMADIWSHGAGVTAMHPTPRRDVGWTAVRKSFQKVATLDSDGKIGIKNQLIQVAGNVACEVGVEQGQFKMAGQPVRV